MNKVICDVCGTSYPETARQCPICGCAAGQGIRVVEVDEEEAAPRTSARGGHFTKSNVRKRNKAAAAGAAPARYDEPDPPQQNGDSNKGLLIAVVALLLAIVAVIIFIVIRFGPEKQDKDKNKQTTGSTVSDQTDPTVPCTKLTVETSLVELSAVGESQKLSVSIEPADTTDKVVYTPSDPSIIRVAEDGTVEALAPGQAIITISCGQFQVKCRVVCNFGTIEETIPDISEDPSKPTDPAPTDPTTPPQTDPPEDSYTVRFNNAVRKNNDVSIDPGEKVTVTLVGSDGKAVKVVWKSSNDEICAVDGNVFTGVSAGTANVKCTYEGETYTCIIRVRKVETTEPGGETTAPTDPPATTDPSEPAGSENSGTTYEIWINGSKNRYYDAEKHLGDVTIGTGKSFTIALVGSDGKAVNVAWTSSNPNVCLVNGNTVKRLKAGKIEVSCVYNGVLYICTVR